jgi:hypothetical protein
VVVMATRGRRCMIRRLDSEEHECIGFGFELGVARTLHDCAYTTPLYRLFSFKPIKNSRPDDSRNHANEDRCREAIIRKLLARESRRRSASLEMMRTALILLLSPPLLLAAGGNAFRFLPERPAVPRSYAEGER